MPTNSCPHCGQPLPERRTPRQTIYRCGEHSLRCPDECQRGFVLTGERRSPRKGEWYLSGALPAAYKARDDLMSAHYAILRARTITDGLL